MIELPDFSKCVEFQRLKEKMGVSVIPPLPPVTFTRMIMKRKEITEQNTEALKLEKRLEKGNVDMKLGDISVDDKGLLHIGGTKVVAYIRDQRKEIDSTKKYSEYRYHLCNCEALRQMRKNGRERRYLTTKRKDGRFKVYDTSGSTSVELDDVTLDLCKLCIRELQKQGLWFTPFSLEKYFEKYDSKVPKTIRRIETVPEVQNYTPDQRELSRKYREAAGYCCQECKVNCSSKPSLLHLHHRDGDRSNNEHTNLSVLCKVCHSREPYHTQVLNKEDVELIKSLRKEQGIIDLGIDL